MPDGRRRRVSRCRDRASASCSRNSDPDGPRAARRGPRMSWVGGPWIRAATRTSPACSWKTTCRSDAGARTPAWRITIGDSRSNRGRSAGLLAKETIDRSMGRPESEGTGFPLRLPDTGDEVFGFRLGRPLGEGAFARVFLAEQADLAGRPGRAEGHRHRGERAADPRPAPARQHRADLLAARGSPCGPARRLHAVPGRGEPLGGPGPALGRLAPADRRRVVRSLARGGRVPAARLVPRGGEGRGGRDGPGGLPADRGSRRPGSRDPHDFAARR